MVYWFDVIENERVCFERVFRPPRVLPLASSLLNLMLVPVVRRVWMVSVIFVLFWVFGVEERGVGRALMVSLFKVLRKD